MNIKVYENTWKDYQLPTGQQFSLSICGLNNDVRYLSFGNDPLKKVLNQDIYINEKAQCEYGHECLAVNCPHNAATNEDLAKLLDVDVNDTVDEETAKQWGSCTNTLIGCFIAMAKRMTEELQSKK